MSLISQLLSERKVWVPTPELTGLVPQVFELYERSVLKHVTLAGLLAGEFQIHCHDTEEPDDGIILKHPEVYDPSQERHIVPPDSKVFAMCRHRTAGLLQAKGVWREEFADFFAHMAVVRQAFEQVLEPLIEDLNRARPDLYKVELNHGLTVIRVMKYLSVREDGSGLSGKLHTDRSALTLHLADTGDGLVLVENGQHELVQTRPGEGLLFMSDKLGHETGIKPVLHGARGAVGRMVLVSFIHLKYRQST